MKAKGFVVHCKDLLFKGCLCFVFFLSFVFALLTFDQQFIMQNKIKACPLWIRTVNKEKKRAVALTSRANLKSPLIRSSRINRCKHKEVSVIY